MAAAGCAVCVAAMTDGRTDDKQERVKPAATQPAKVNTQKSAYSRLNTDGAEDGIPYGLRLMDVNDREVTLSWLSPEKTNGYWEDFETHNDFQINSPGSIGWQCFSLGLIFMLATVVAFSSVSVLSGRLFARFNRTAKGQVLLNKACALIFVTLAVLLLVAEF